MTSILHYEICHVLMYKIYKNIQKECIIPLHIFKAMKSGCDLQNTEQWAKEVSQTNSENLD